MANAGDASAGQRLKGLLQLKQQHPISGLDPQRMKMLYSMSSLSIPFGPGSCWSRGIGVHRQRALYWCDHLKDAWHIDLKPNEINAHQTVFDGVHMITCTQNLKCLIFFINSMRMSSAGLQMTDAHAETL